MPGAVSATPGGRELLAGALTAEGGNPQDMEYIASVIGNRMRNGNWGDNLSDVILAPGQFSAFNNLTGYAGGEGGNEHWRNPSPSAYSVADAFLAGHIPDRTGNALNYYNPTLANPTWGGDRFSRLPGSAHVFGTAGG